MSLPGSFWTPAFAGVTGGKADPAGLDLLWTLAFAGMTVWMGFAIISFDKNLSDTLT